MNAVNADQWGMLATVINALAVEDALCRLGQKATVFTAQEMNRFARLYTDTDLEYLGIFPSVATLGAAVAGARFDLSIVLPAPGDEASARFQGKILLTLLASGILSAAVSVLMWRLLL